MNPAGFVAVLRARWIVVGIASTLGALAGVVFTLLTPTTFSSSTQLFLTTPGWGYPTTLGNSDSSPFQGDQFTQQRAGTYTMLAEGSDFIERVAARLGESGFHGVEGLSVRVVPDTVLLEITGTADSADRAFQITNAASAEMDETVRRLETPSGTLIPIVQPLTVVTAKPASEPAGPAAIPNVLLGLVLGSAFGATWVTFAAARSRKFTDVGRLASWTGLPVLEFVRRPPVDDQVDSDSRGSFARLQFNRELIGGGSGARESPVLVTAAEEGPNSAYVAQGVAEASSALGYSVVLVDCDFRTRRAHVEPGVTDIVLAHADLEEVLVPARLQGPARLTSGSATATPEAVLESESFRRLMGTLSTRYDRVVVFDSGGTEYVDSGRLVQVCASVIVVVESNSTERQTLVGKIDDLRLAGARIEGSVLVGNPNEHERRSAFVSGTQDAAAVSGAVGTTDRPTPPLEGDTRTRRSRRKANT
ncbi:Mrp family chromosome partitioning ATPase [Rhodococcus sp. 27YEA15]|uniref:hypothetical protein n=1 Tax=Rhodococcus sp. 27YEA15 TaxID=3156259 RepID=UPI003C7CA328